MKRLLILILAVGLVAGVYYLYKNKSEESQGHEVMATYTDPDFGFSFDYRENPAGYMVIEATPSGQTPELQKIVIIMQKEDYESIQRGEREGGEGPPTITVQVFNNQADLSPQAWIEANPQASNFPLIMGEISDATIDGLDGVTYSADGLYPNRNAVFADEDYIYYLNGAYLDQDSPLYRDWEPFLESFEVK